MFVLRSRYDELVTSRAFYLKRYLAEINKVADLKAVNCRLEDQIRKQIKADIVLEMLGDVGLDESILKWEKFKETR